MARVAPWLTGSLGLEMATGRVQRSPQSDDVVNMMVERKLAPEPEISA